MRKIVLAIALLLCFSTTYAQVTKVDDLKKSLQSDGVDTNKWKWGGVFNFAVNQGFLHNWASGGELASLSVNTLFSVYVNHQYHGAVWANNLDLAYGLNYAYSTAFIPHKSDDRIDFTSKYGKAVDTGKHFFITALFNFKSQFTKGFDYTRNNWDSASTSKFLSPAYLTLAVGMEYRKGDNLSLFLSPIAGREVLASSYYTNMRPQGAFGIGYGKTSVFQLGAYFSGRYAVNFTKNMSFKTRLDLYANYLAKDTKDNLGYVIKKDNPGNIQVFWDNLFAWKASKYFSFLIGATVTYDNNVPYMPAKTDDPAKGLGWVQLKEIFTAGLEYKF